MEQVLNQELVLDIEEVLDLELVLDMEEVLNHEVCTILTLSKV